MSWLILLCGCVVALWVWGYRLLPAQGQERHPGVDRVKEAEHPMDVAEAHRALFERISARYLKRLIADNDDEIALAAAWQRVLRTIPKESFEEFTPDPRALNRFLGTLEGRLRVALPFWWEQGILNTLSGGRDDIGYWPANHLVEWDRRESEDGVWLPWGVEIEQVNEHWRVSRDGEQIQLPMDVWQPGGWQGTGLEVQFVGDRCYVAAHGPLGADYSLYCFDREGGEMLWEVIVWGTGGLGGGSGTHDHWVELVPADDQVLLFGLSTLGAYIEAFDSETGENTLRFGTRYFMF